MNHMIVQINIFLWNTKMNTFMVDYVKFPQQHMINCNPVNTKHLHSINTMLHQRRRRRADGV